MLDGRIDGRTDSIERKTYIHNVPYQYSTIETFKSVVLYWLFFLNMFYFLHKIVMITRACTMFFDNYTSWVGANSNELFRKITRMKFSLSSLRFLYPTSIQVDETQEGKHKIPWKRILKRFAKALPLDLLTWLMVTF